MLVGQRPVLTRFTGSNGPEADLRQSSCDVAAFKHSTRIAMHERLQRAGERTFNVQVWPAASAAQQALRSG